MKRGKMRLAQAASFGTIVALASTGAAAQGVSGTALGAPEPGRFATSFDIGISLIEMPRFRFGDRYNPITTGAPSIGPIFDTNNDREGGIAPSIALGWGVPGGLFGQQAEVFGQFAFARATQSGAFSEPNTSTGGITLPFANTATFSGITATGFTFFSGKATQQPSFSRSLNSYDGQIGARLHMRMAGWTLSPGAYIGFQRTDLDESVSAALNGLTYNLSSAVASDYYQVGLSLGATYPLSQQMALFGVLQGGLDYIRSRLDSSSNLFFAGKGSFLAAAGDRDNRVSGRVGLRGGLAFSPTPAFTLTVSGLVQYIGSVSNVVYPTHSPVTGSFPNNGTVPARLASDDQLNFGFALGGTFRF
jgi:hypothetical protein